VIQRSELVVIQGGRSEIGNELGSISPKLR
jgi:hypothetical protein